MTQFLLIGVAGAFGTWARYFMSFLALRALGTTLPYSTLAVNIIGSFLIALIMQIGLSTELISPTTRIVLTTGFLGGFTTYSSFSYETIQYFSEGEFFKGWVNFLLMSCSCLVAAWLGLALAKRF